MGPVFFRHRVDKAVLAPYLLGAVCGVCVYVVSADLAVFVGILLFCFINLVLICLV